MVDARTSIIVGCTVGGFLLALAVLLVIIYLYRTSKKRRQYKENLKVDVADGYTTFSLQKPGMPPLGPQGARPSGHLGGHWTPSMQAMTPPGSVSGYQAKAINISPATLQIRPNGNPDSGLKTPAHAANTPAGAHNNKKKLVPVESHHHCSTESVHSVTSVDGGSFGSETELIPTKSKHEKGRAQDKMSVIEEETTSRLKQQQQQREGARGKNQKKPDEEGPSQYLPVLPQVHPPIRDPSTRNSDTDRPVTVYPPAADHFQVQAVIESQPKENRPSSHAPLSTTTSEDKRQILDAFRFLEDFDD